MNEPVRLVLEDGTEIAGKSFGAEASAAGEVVFNTAMTGYPESLTDPSYRGQILVLTYPLIGNYGVPPMEEGDDGLPRHFESSRVHVAGLVISDYSVLSHHWSKRKSLAEWLIEHRVPAMYDVDTRALTKHLRERGAMPGRMEFGGQRAAPADPGAENPVAAVSTRKKATYGAGRRRILLVDCGVKYNIIRRLLTRDTTVVRVPWDHDFSREDYDGLFVSNGPGDPKRCAPTIRHLRAALEDDRPIFGICLGNQLLCLAAGGDTFKLKYGHRSHNQPVLRAGTERCYITSQNHGYAANARTLDPDDWEELFVNVNDGTNEGLRHRRRPFFSAQFHPEASSGPTDTDWLFDEFLGLVGEARRG